MTHLSLKKKKNLLPPRPRLSKWSLHLEGRFFPPQERSWRDPRRASASVSGVQKEPKHRHGPAGLHPFPLSLTYPGLPFQLSVQIGALELLDYLGNNESEIRLLLQHFPGPSPPSSRGKPLAGREPATYEVSLRASDTSRGTYYAGTPPAGVTRQLPGRVSVPLWSPPRLKAPAPAFRWQKTTCGVGGGE